VTDHTPLGPGPEFDLVRAILARYGAAGAGIGDDAATVTVPPGEELLVSTDVAVEDVHFRAGWLLPDEVGFRSVMAALSDLAAMAATPRGIVVALTLPEHWRANVDELADGIARAARECGVPIVGGDLSHGDALSIAVTVIGSAARPLRRSGACVGDALWVTGTLGGPALALHALLSGRKPAPEHRARFAAPRARIAEARWLAAHGATSGMDISDGLAADAGHLAAASVVRIVLDIDRVPRVAGATAVEAAASGEEYELLVTAPAGLDAAAFAREFGVPLTNIGRVEAAGSRPAGVDALNAGAAVPLPTGFSHFTS
jgi:thiamine-monophosphate kinase